MTLDELIAYIRGKNFVFNVDIEEVGPTDEWTTAEQISDCCEVVLDFDECVEDGKIEPWDSMTDDMAQEVGLIPDGYTVNELFNMAESNVGHGNVHLQVNLVGPAGSCGEIETTWTDTLGCCVNPPELLKNSGSTLLTVGQDYGYSVVSTSGTVPVTWSVYGAGLEIQGAGANATVHVNDCFCKPGLVVATDACSAAAVWVVSRSGGTWSVTDTETLDGMFGWLQDGDLSDFIVRGYNDDKTKVSQQDYLSGRYYAPDVQTVCDAGYLGLSDSSIAVPADLGGYAKCTDSEVWLRLADGFTDVYDVIWAAGTGATVEFEHECMDDEMEYDDDASADVIADDSSGTVAWTEGQGPFIVSVSGTEFYVNSGRTATQISTSNRSQAIYTADACGAAEITITDSCGSSVSGVIRAADGYWITRYTNDHGGISGTYDANTGTETLAPYEGGCPVEGVEGASWHSRGALQEYDLGNWKIELRIDSASITGTTPGDCYESNDVGTYAVLTARCATDSAKSVCQDNYRYPRSAESGITCMTSPNYYLTSESCNSLTWDGNIPEAYGYPWVSAESVKFVGAVTSRQGLSSYYYGFAYYQVTWFVLKEWVC